MFCFFVFFNDTATTEIYTLSLHDALPIYLRCVAALVIIAVWEEFQTASETVEQEANALAEIFWLAHRLPEPEGDRKSTRLNSSHANISYAVFCLKKHDEHDVVAAARSPAR